MPYLIGIGLALAVALLGRLVGFERSRAFYPTVTIVVASYYGLFAVLGGSLRALGLEAAVMAGFILAAILGFRLSLWWVVGALFGHGVFDFFHGHLIANPGLPAWWPQFCLAYDVTAAAYLAWLLRRGQPGARSR